MTEGKDRSEGRGNVPVALDLMRMALALLDREAGLPASASAVRLRGAIHLLTGGEATPADRLGGDNRTPFVDGPALSLAELHARIRVRHDPPSDDEAGEWVLAFDQDTSRPSWASRRELKAFWARRFPSARLAE